MLTRLFVNQRGMSMIATLALVGLVGFISMAIATWNDHQNKMIRQTNVTVVAEQIKHKLLGNILSPESWQKTQERNASAFTHFTPGHAVDLNLYSAESSVVYYRGTDPTAGFTLQGNPCESGNLFNALEGSDTCPFHYDVKLKSRVLQGGNWLDTVSLAMTFKPRTLKYVLNANSAKFSFQITRNFNDRSVETTCISAGGSYSATSGRCQVLLTQVATCSRFYKGPSPDSAYGQCGNSTQTFSCPPGQAIQRMDSSGTPVCGAIAP